MSISLDAWLAMSSKRRALMLSADEDDEGDDVDQLLSAIHPSLRVAEPRQVADWEDLQFAHERRGKFMQQSNSSRTSLQGDVAEQLAAARQDVSTGLYQINTKLETLSAQERLMRKIEQMEQEQQRGREREHELEEERRRDKERAEQEIRELRAEADRARFEAESAKIQLHPSSDLLRISGSDQSAQRTIEHVHSNENPAYEAFRTIRAHDQTLNRYYLQPHDAASGSEAYQPAVRHFTDKQRSPIAAMLSNASISLTFHCDIEGVSRNFVFRESPHSNKTLLEYIDAVYDEQGGSDTFRRLRSNITGVSVNVVVPHAGGCNGGESLESHSRGGWLTVFDYKKAHDDSCFYACIRNIQKSVNGVAPKQHYKTMRKLLTGSPYDAPVTIDSLDRVEEVFGVKIIVLGPDAPTIEFKRPPKEQNTYAALQGSYHVTYPTLYFNGRIRQLTETSDGPFALRRLGDSLLVQLDGDSVEYHLLSLSNSHYSNVVGLTRPMVCLKCGSRTHTERDTARDVVKLECLETVKDQLSAKAYDEARPRLGHVIFDFETIRIDGLLTPYSVAWAVDDEEPRVVVGQDCLKRFMGAIHSLPGVKLLIGYNSSRFDNFFVVQSLLLGGTKLSSSNCTIHNNQILGVKTRDIRVWDICQFTKCTLQQACEAFNVQIDDSLVASEHRGLVGKLEFDHKYVQAQFDVYGWDFIRYVGEDVIKEYNIRDVLVTRQLFRMVTPSLKRITDMDPLQCMTLSQLAFKHMQAHNKKQGIKFERLPIELDKVFDSVPGGRVQLFVEPAECLGDHVQVDVNGLYQYIALHYDMPTGEMGDWSMFEDVPAELLLKGLYLVSCVVDQSSLGGIKLVGLKSKEERIDWTADHVEAWLWGEEIDELERLGCLVKKTRTLTWSARMRPFEIMLLYRAIRAAEQAEGRGGGVVDSMAKLMSNAITGKTYQRNREDEWAIVNTPAESEGFRSKHKNVLFDTTDIPGMYYMEGDKLVPKELISKPRHIGARIYAMARLYMFQTISSLTSIKYMDTDGFIMAKWEYLQHPELHDSPELGKMKVEAEGDHVYLVSLKNYAICDYSTGKPTCMLPIHKSKAELKACEKRGRHHHKYRLKGYHDGDLWQSEDREYMGKFVCEDLYKALLRGPVTTTTERIRKQFVRVSDGKYQLSTITMQSEERLIV